MGRSRPRRRPQRGAPQLNARLFTFVGGDAGDWRIVRLTAVTGPALPPAARLAVIPGDAAPAAAQWSLRGITSNERYVTRDERAGLVARQPALGRPEAVRAALIPIRKSARWWGLTQEERREIFEEQAHHVAIGLHYLPAVARRLHHCRDLSESEPFDFLTWFAWAPADEPAFDRLLAELRASPEWNWVEREIEIRVTREHSASCTAQV